MEEEEGEIEIYRKNNQVEETSSSSGSHCSRRKISRIWNASAGGFKHNFLQRPVKLLTSATVSQEAHKHKLTQ
jgi:hypothetical protein